MYRVSLAWRGHAPSDVSSYVVQYLVQYELGTLYVHELLHVLPVVQPTYTSQSTNAFFVQFFKLF